MTREDIVKYVRAQDKMVGHHKRVEKTKTMRKITEWNPIGMRSKERLKSRRGDQMLNYLKKFKVKDWPYKKSKREMPGTNWFGGTNPTKCCFVSRREDLDHLV